MRAKSIKNKARVNVEMSPAELKALLKKTVAELAAVREHAASLEEEIKVWRSGGTVDQSQWTQSLAAATASTIPAAAPRRPAPASPAPFTSGTSTPGSRSATPGGLLSPAFDSRPDTPTAYSTTSMDKDEREEFLRRENELADQLSEKESAYNNLEKQMADLKDELAYHREQEVNMETVSHRRW